MTSPTEKRELNGKTEYVFYLLFRKNKESILYYWKKLLMQVHKNCTPVAQQHSISYQSYFASL